MTVLTAQEPRIADNSLLIEEAYNQEAGVVQHITACQASGPGRRDLDCTFTQEWPLGGMRNQFSYTVPFAARGSAAGGVGDVFLNYRFQWISTARLASSPRASVVLPTGSWRDGRGTGSPGLQLNMPVSVRITPDVVAHANAGVTLTPRARAADGSRHGLTSYSLGASVIGPVRRSVNVVVEFVTLFDAVTGPTGAVSRTTDVVLNPGFRFALDVGQVQVVPGFSVPIHVNDTGTPTDLFFYLSFEHPFRSTRAGTPRP